ncbi:MAG: DUF4231 domain-containing protein [Oscillospiraceae bacterium]|nr:DUF4231 domain-containing protein [Oscillospiraceae bacterium]
MSTKDEYLVLEDVVRNTFAGSVWSHKIHEKQADQYAKKYHTMETINIFCASLTSAGVVGTILCDEMWLKVITAVLSFVTIFCSAYFKSFSLQDLIDKNRSTAHSIICCRNDLVTLLTEIRIRTGTPEELTEKYKAILEKLNEAYASAPTTTKNAVEEAEVALKDKEEYTYSDQEIDRFLPPHLRRGDNKA